MRAAAARRVVRAGSGAVSRGSTTDSAATTSPASRSGTAIPVETGSTVPLREAGEVVAALSVVLPRETAPEPALAALRTAAARIEADLRADRR